MKLQALPLIQPVENVFGPVPTEWALAKMPHPAGDLVVVQFSTPVGVQLFFLTQESAKQLQDGLGQLTGSGIVIVPAGTVLK